MTSKEALKYLLADSELLYCEHEEDIKFYLEAEKEYNIVLKDLDRLEKLEKENQVLREKVNHFKNVKNRMRRNCKFYEKENNKLKNVIEILEEEPAILKFPFEDWKYDEEQNLYYCITEIYEYSCDYGDYFWETVKYIYSEENFKLLKEVLGND